VWFGEPGRCAAFNVVLAVLGTCALGDFFISFIMVWIFFFRAEVESDGNTLSRARISPCFAACRCSWGLRRQRESSGRQGVGLSSVLEGLACWSFLNYAKARNLCPSLVNGTCMGSLLGNSEVWYPVINLLSWCRFMFPLTVMAMTMELGVLGVTMFSLLSELCRPHLAISKNGSAWQKKRTEDVATSVSIAASIIT
jgi:hypothetical protein